MPSKYLIHPIPTPPRFRPLSRSGVIAWEEGCLRCGHCVKKKCVYGVYEKRGLDPYQMMESIDNECMNCLRCVQGCPKQLIHKSFSKEFEEMGRGPFTPEVIYKIWQQATTGKVPVSGAGYRGPFSGPGFDSMWTDMSEIVRPTRDGIHGREYISTAVDIGERPDHLESFSKGWEYNFITIPLPMVFRVPEVGKLGRNLLKGWVGAARSLGTILFIADRELPWIPPKYYGNLFVILSGQKQQDLIGLREGIAGIESSDLELLQRVKGDHKWQKEPLWILKVPFTKFTAAKVEEAYQKGVRVFHLYGTFEGTFVDSSAHIKEGIRQVHLRLLEMGVRDQVSILISGGIAMAEHVAKAIILGADLVVLDTVLKLALECRLCDRCEMELPCPVKLEEADPRWASKRVINLISAWHLQLLEVLGAMGIRDVRRLRGETGRSMFFEELEREVFSTLCRLGEEEEIEHT